jgi:hypothetical protein
MVSLTSLLLPILLSAVLVFVASSILHMMLPWHRDDIASLPMEDDVMAALRRTGAPPGDYMLPYAGTPARMKEPAYIEKVKAGPAAFLTIFPPMPTGRPEMGAQLTQWFIYCLIVSLFAAYIAGRALGPGAEYLEVFRFAGTTAFVGYALALLQNSIWWRRKWSGTIKTMIDGLVYSLLTAGVFGWLWPS